MYSLLAFIARLFISLVFIVAGVTKILTFNATLQWMQGHGIESATPLLIIAILIEILCGLGILFGLKARFCSLILFIFLAIVTCIFHLDFQDPIQRSEFLKNLAILGALLMVLLHGAGPWSASSPDF